MIFIRWLAAFAGAALFLLGAAQSLQSLRRTLFYDGSAAYNAGGTLNSSYHDIRFGIHFLALVLMFCGALSIFLAVLPWICARLKNRQNRPKPPI